MGQISPGGESHDPDFVRIDRPFLSLRPYDLYRPLTIGMDRLKDSIVGILQGGAIFHHDAGDAITKKPAGDIESLLIHHDPFKGTAGKDDNSRLRGAADIRLENHQAGFVHIMNRTILSVFIAVRAPVFDPFVLTPLDCLVRHSLRPQGHP